MVYLIESLIRSHVPLTLFFFFTDTATTEIYTLSLHDALPIFPPWIKPNPLLISASMEYHDNRVNYRRSEEHTSELQSQFHLVCRLLLEKKNAPPSAQRTSFRHRRELVRTATRQ